MTFLFYGLDSTSNVIKFIAKAKKSQQLEKVMLNPRIKFEYKEGQFYDIVASKAINKGQDNVELFDVTATSNAGNIKAGKLLVTNDGNNLHFSDHPVLIIKESKNNEQ